MESQLHHHNPNQEDPQKVGLHSVIEDEGEQEHHGEKKSVLKKVKDKAKKIKDTIKKHGHGHGHEHEGGDHNYQEGYEEDDDDEEMVNDPEIHGGKEAEVTPLVREFGNLNVRNASASKPELAPQHVPTKNKYDPEPNPIDTPENQDSNMKTQDPAVLKDTPQDTITITGKVSSATSAIADKALSAKNLVASKLGYGGDSSQEGKDPSKKSVPESSATDKVAEKLAPVYGKVTGVGSAVMSKVHGQGGDAGAAGGDNKTVSMREYLAEKFRPGDEDKALSEVITNAFHKKKEEKKEERPMGKVTESEEVAARLGRTADNKREGEDAVRAGSESSGQGVTDRLKDAVSSWLGKSTGVQTAQDSIGKSFVSGAGSGSTGVGPGEEAYVQPTN
ncbi:hypothetical protein CDL12_13914 [Handroanthus impetiginosus]|uniref:Low-temperature-induced 65 kDa protein n=1 Tax=Handroanthus impetiginosus TaxID=429701 RepID=A0A2G9H7H1_9LAMI|nr:hypothetical protein CDL12_13914 [Handroanthus impetiginosus]